MLVHLCFITFPYRHAPRPSSSFTFNTVLQDNQNKALYIYSHLKSSPLYTKITRKSVSAPLQALGEGKRQKGKIEAEEEEEEAEEGQAVRKTEEEGDEETTVTGGAEPATMLRFGIVIAVGKNRVAVRQKTEEGGRGER